MDDRAQNESPAGQEGAAFPPAIAAYRRPDGRVGIRNHVAVIPVDDISNRAAEAVAALIPGVLALQHAYGRLQFGADLELHFRTLAGLGCNPNVAAVVVIGIEPVWTRRLVERIEPSGKPVTGYAISGEGDLQTIVAAARAAKRFLQDASELQREPCPLADVSCSVKCGESDTTSGLASNPTVGWVVDRLGAAGGTILFGETTELTGGEHIVAARCATPDIGAQFLAKCHAYNEEILRHKSSDLLESNPTQGNIRGGISTIEEKALGALTKIGRRTPVAGVVDTAEPPGARGLWFMDSPGAGAEILTAYAAAGVALNLFTTGQGNVVGNPILPVLKVGANPAATAAMADHIDVDVSDLLQRRITLDQAGRMVLEVMRRTCNGRLTAAEALGHREISMTRLFRSA